MGGLHRPVPLAVIRPVAVQVKYDTFITVYMSDCDFYPRVRAAGYQTIESYHTCPETRNLTVREPSELPSQNIQ